MFNFAIVLKLQLRLPAYMDLYGICISGLFKHYGFFSPNFFRSSWANFFLNELQLWKHILGFSCDTHNPRLFSWVGKVALSGFPAIISPDSLDFGTPP